MIDQPKHKIFGIALSDWIEKIPNELDSDAVGLWQIIPTFRENFELSGAALSDATRQSIIGLINRGAVPVDGINWERLNKYGSSPEEIAQNVISEWEKSGQDPSLDGLWFSLPE